MGAFIQLNRLIVFRRGQRVYDQEYHEGLNIIYGTNGSGKSTIADLIFYSMRSLLNIQCQALQLRLRGTSRKSLLGQ